MTDTSEVARTPPTSPTEPDYHISFEPNNHRIRIIYNGVTIADSTRTVICRETRYPPVYYFPRADVRMDLLHRTVHHSHCPFKGNASYWALEVNGRSAENVVWSYEDPFPEAAPVKDYLAFYNDRMDAVLVDEAPAIAPPDISNPYDNPLTRWLLGEACQSTSPSDLLERFAHILPGAGISVERIWLVMRTLHPLLFSTAYVWLPDTEVQERHVTHDILRDEKYLASPLAPIFQGAGGVRRRIEDPATHFDYPILEDLHKDGFSDYVAMPLEFSDGQINVISLATKRQGGFTTAMLGYIYEALPLLSRLLEVHAMRRNAMNLLDAYLGHQAGAKVLNGLVRRGDGQDIHAVIWFCDLRGSTPLADSLPRPEFLDLLNQFFDCMAGAVLDHEGEVLRFIGDAVLAIFPIGDPATERQPGCPLTFKACQNALAAARDARSRIAELNQERQTSKQPPLRFGIGLHLGDVMYGNIGTPQRLEFTVIGAAANEAARIESLCKTTDKAILMSEKFACHCTLELVSVGHYKLRGVKAEQEIFTLL